MAEKINNPLTHVTADLKDLDKHTGQVMKTATLITDSYSYSLDVDKIETLEDVKLILSKLPINLNEHGIKGIEHLVTKREHYRLG